MARPIKRARKPITDEQRAHMSDAGKARWARHHLTHPAHPKRPARKRRHSIKRNHGLGD